MTREEWLEKWTARPLPPGALAIRPAVLADALDLAEVFEPQRTMDGLRYVAGDDILRFDVVQLGMDGKAWARPGNTPMHSGLMYQARCTAKRGEVVVVEPWRK